MTDRSTNVVIAMAVGSLVLLATTWLVPVGNDSQAVHDFAGPYTGLGLLDGPWQTTESAPQKQLGLASGQRRVLVAVRVRHGGAEPRGRRCSRLSFRSRVTEHETTRLGAWSTELRRVHTRIRDALQITRQAVRDGTPSQHASRDLLLYCHGFCAALDGHHQGEDRALFPAIEAAHPHLTPVLRALKQDHSMISHLLQGLRDALDRSAAPDELDRHLEGVAAIMENHFRYEERQLITVLETLELHAAVKDVFGPL